MGDDSEIFQLIAFELIDRAKLIDQVIRYFNTAVENLLKRVMRFVPELMGYRAVGNVSLCFLEIFVSVLEELKMV